MSAHTYDPMIYRRNPTLLDEWRQDVAALLAGKIRTVRWDGERNGMAKLTEADVRQIRKLWQANPKRGYQKELAYRYNVKPATISAIVTYKTWQDVTLDPPPS